MISKEQATQNFRELRTNIAKDLQLARLKANLDIDYVAFKLSTSMKRIERVENAKIGMLNLNELIQIARLYDKKIKVILEDC
ncbi:MAG: hypothetical protein R3Y43_00095 [Alphaproteobacteria bacterium]